MSFLLEQIDIFEKIRHIEPIEDLFYQSNSRFSISSQEEILYPIVEENDIIIVSGSFFGDEGKGKTTDAIARHEKVKIILRANSGENAGHSVYYKEKKYVLHLTPSSIFIPDKTSLIGDECVMDIVNYKNKELSQLVEAGIDYKEKLFLGNVHVVGPYHKILDYIINPTNSSTLKGMSPIQISKVSKRALKLNQLFNSKDDQKKTLEKDLLLYHSILKHKEMDELKIIDSFNKKNETSGKKEVPDHLIDFLKTSNKIDYLLSLYEDTVNDDTFPNRVNISDIVNKTLERGSKVLIEGPQSFFLSNAKSTHYRSTTAAQTHASGILASTPINPFIYKITNINVAKTPGDSRVGIGANPSSFVNQSYYSDQGIDSLKKMDKNAFNSAFEEIQKKYFESVQENGILEPTSINIGDKEYHIGEAFAVSSALEFEEFGATTGKPRVTGLFDCLAAYVVNKDQGPHLTISALDRGDEMDNVGLVVGYVYHNTKGEQVDDNGTIYKNGDVIRIGDPYPTEAVLHHCRPIIKVMPSWKGEPLKDMTPDSGKELPRNLSAYLGAIEELTGFNIISIGNGPKTPNVLYVKKAS